MKTAYPWFPGLEVLDARVCRFRDMAEKMESRIREKLHPATADQNPTRRRIRIINGMRQGGERLQKVQAYLRALADAVEKGALPPGLENIRTRADVEALLRENDPALLSLSVVLPEDRDVKLRDMINNLVGSKLPGFINTPPDIARRMVRMAGLSDGLSILEPSAGIGSIADAIREQIQGYRKATLEIRYMLKTILEYKGYKVAHDDFLTYEGRHDCIIMNPPFESGQDVDHVMHAFKLLNPVGRLVGIMCEGPFCRQDKKSEAFREWFASETGHSEKLPDHTFTGPGVLRQSGVAARIVVMDK